MVSQTVFLEDFADLSQACRSHHGGGLPKFLETESVVKLGWPDDVTEQWLYDHADNGHFHDDYGNVDLSTLDWRDELVPVAEFATMPTGPSDYGALEGYAADPDYWSDVRSHQGVPQHWESAGTWLRQPLLIDRRLLAPPGDGLQVIEGRTRVGILRGYIQTKRRVAPTHAAWVARPR